MDPFYFASLFIVDAVGSGCLSDPGSPLGLKRNANARTQMLAGQPPLFTPSFKHFRPNHDALKSPEIWFSARDHDSGRRENMRGPTPKCLPRP